MPMLIKILQMTNGSVMELGGGAFSTPLLHWLCAEKERELVTYENNLDYEKFLKTFVSKNHSIRFIKDWKDIDMQTHWSVVFIDHSPAIRRSIDAIRLKDKADYIILHDSNQDHGYGYENVWEHFKYRYDWKFATPNVTVVSNFRDLTHL